jgi:hypothetical protein
MNLRNLRTNLRPLAYALALGSLTACSTPKPEPEIASAAPQGHYAQSYPQALTQASSGFSKTQNDVRAGTKEFNEYPSKLKNPDWNHVRDIMKAADGAGRSYAYVERIRRVDGASAFFTDEKDEITKKVAGSATYVAKSKGCDVDLSGAVSASLKEAVEKQLEKELRDANEGQQLIERYRVSLGKENAAALEKQVDNVSRMAYLAHIEIVEEKLRIVRMTAEAEDVRKSIDEFIRAEKEFQAEKKTTDAEKKASEERIAEMNKSKASLDAAIQQGKDLEPKLEEQVQALKKEYDDAFGGLVVKIDNHAKTEQK